VLDHYLSNQFIRWPILSPNYFYLVDRQTWLWLWSKPAKALNTGLVTLLLIGAPVPVAGDCGHDRAHLGAAVVRAADPDPERLRRTRAIHGPG